MVFLKFEVIFIVSDGKSYFLHILILNCNEVVRKMYFLVKIKPRLTTLLLDVTEANGHFQVLINVIK